MRQRNRCEKKILDRLLKIQNIFSVGKKSSTGGIYWFLKPTLCNCSHGSRSGWRIDASVCRSMAATATTIRAQLVRKVTLLIFSMHFENIPAPRKTWRPCPRWILRQHISSESMLHTKITTLSALKTQLGCMHSSSLNAFHFQTWHIHCPSGTNKNLKLVNIWVLRHQVDVITLIVQHWHTYFKRRSDICLLVPTQRPCDRAAGLTLGLVLLHYTFIKRVGWSKKWNID